MGDFEDDFGKRIVAGELFKKDGVWRCKCGAHCKAEMQPTKTKTELLSFLRQDWKRNYAKWWCQNCFANPPTFRR